ncbi:hypothetical protein LEP1GSC058_0354 [Leptospira fainei serovar Hurstbridge str. BUT 6]|uniref:Uncharacterized protein n=2 Tax=Leptospira fainei TaxID=48782 RepID=S3VHB6_9LEPT|nr:hypothetical protein LEP1GSC058_0354 [Leptospira fainei serovar Hurstbridge str. BUT 6]
MAFKPLSSNAKGIVQATLSVSNNEIAAQRFLVSSHQSIES